MNAYQLACGCWESSPARYETGGVFPCRRHGRQLVIGVSRREA